MEHTHQKGYPARAAGMALLMALIFCLALLNTAQAEEAETITLYGVAVSLQDEQLDLSGQGIANAQELQEKLPQLENLKEVSLGASQLTMDQIKELQGAFPDIAFHWETEQYGQRVTSDQTTLDLGEVGIEGGEDGAGFQEFVTLLDCLPNLTKVDMYETSLKKSNNIDIDFLADRYPDIRFGWTLRIGTKDCLHLVRTDATAFSTLHNRNSPTHKSADFAPLRYCKDMMALDIGHNAVDDISFLADMPQMKVLIIAINNIVDISPLAGLTGLEYAEIFNNQIVDISPLAGLTNLLDLNICFNHIKDYTPLYGMDKLERLWLYCSNTYKYGSTVPEEDLAGLTEALPDCYIDSEFYSTLGGWREHPRYDTIFYIFNGGGYIPFEPMDYVWTWPIK